MASSPCSILLMQNMAKTRRGTTNNLLDYKDGTDIAAFQWNVMANPAVFTAMDKAKDGEINLKKRRISWIYA